MLWITFNHSRAGHRLLFKGLAALLTLTLLNACGSKRSMEGARSDEELGSLYQDDADSIEGIEEEGQEEVSFDEDAARSRRVAQAKGGSTRSGPGKLDQVTTQAGDTLWKIAERKNVYGSGWLYPLIYKANRELIKDPQNLEGGLLLKIPRDVPDPEVEIAKEEAMTGQFLNPAPRVEEVQAPPPPPPPAGGQRWLWILLAALLAAGGAAAAWRRRRLRQAAASPA